MMKGAMKKILMLVSIVALLLVGACPIPTRLVRLTLVNRSPDRVAVQLTGLDVTTSFYYLTLPKSVAGQPVEKTFTIMSQRYSAEIFYLEIYDPVYGFKCSQNPSSNVTASHNLRFIILKCGSTVIKKKDTYTLKF